MIGVLINFLTVVLGGIVGCLMRGKLKDDLRLHINRGLALCVMLIGIKGAIETQNVLCVILCIVLGTLLGLALLGGSIGAFMGMLIFRHKTRHKKFKILVPLFLAGDNGDFHVSVLKVRRARP